MNIRKEQLAAVSYAGRRDRLAKAFAEKGFQVDRDKATQAVLVTDAEGRTSRVDVTADGATEIITGESRRFALWHDDSGRLRRVTDPTGATADFVHDPIGRLNRVERGSGKVHEFQYDGEGRLTEMSFPDKTRVRFQQGNEERLVVDRNGGQWRQTVDGRDRIRSMQDPLGHLTRYDFGRGEFASRIALADGTVNDFKFDEDGGLKAWTINGQTHATYELDEEKKSFAAQYADGHEVALTMEGERVVEARTPDSVVKLAYDKAGNILSEDQNGKVVEYVYDKTGLLSAIVNPDKEELRFERDREGRVVAIADWTKARTTIKYHLSGALAEVKCPNGVTTSLGANADGLTTSVKVKAAERSLLDLSYTHDANDRVASQFDGKRLRKYKYDGEGRLIRVECEEYEAFDERFALDAAGNCIESGGEGRQYDALNRLISAGGQGCKYDPLGNVIAGPTPRGPANLEFNGQGRLSSLAIAQGRRAVYQYDAFGRRIRKTVGETVTEYVWAGQTLLYEETTGPAAYKRRDHLFIPGTFQPLAMRVDGRTYYQHVDWAGVPQLMTDDKAKPVWQATYAAFGQANSTIREVANPWRLPNQYFDDESGLHYNLARYYHPAWGRYLSPDPLRARGGGWNYYLYAQGDPINKADPTGEIIPVLIAIGVGMVVGAAIGAGMEYYKQRKEISQGKRDEIDSDGIIAQGILGGLVGAVGGAVGALAGMAVGAALAGKAVASTIGAIMAIGAAEGVAGAIAEVCVEKGVQGENVTAGDLLFAGIVGGVIGAVTGGIGGWIAARAARKAAQKTMQDATETAVRQKTRPMVRSADDKISKRQKDNKALSESDQLAKDMEARGVSQERLQWMKDKKCPLSFKNPAQYEQFKKELAEVLKRNGLDDTTAGMKGTSTTFYSENPKKPLGHHFDADPTAPADVDVDISGPALAEKMAAAGKQPHPDMPHIYKTKDTYEAVPELKEFADKWETELGREVNFVGMTDTGPRPTESGDYILN